MFSLLGLGLLSLSLSSLVSADHDSAVELCELINDYRQENGLSRIPFSTTLFGVGNEHIVNFVEAENRGIYGSDSSCNLHTWYDVGSNDYTACCYTSDHAEAQCMWDKPREISTAWSGLEYFSGNGYENSAAGYGSNEAALDGWKASSGHNDVILNQNGWESITWQSLGCGSDTTERYYFAWFSDSTDPNEFADAPTPPPVPTAPPVPTPPPTPRPTNRPTTKSPTGSYTCSGSDPCYVTWTVSYTLENPSADYWNAYLAVKSPSTALISESCTRGYYWGATIGYTYTKFSVEVYSTSDASTLYTGAHSDTFQGQVRSNLASYLKSGTDVTFTIEDVAKSQAQNAEDDDKKKNNNNNKKPAWWVWLLVVLACLFVGAACALGVIVWRRRNASGTKWGQGGSTQYHHMVDYN